MPTVNLFTLQGRSESQRKEAVEGITAVLCKAFKVDRDEVVINLVELPKNSVAQGGVFLSGRLK